MKQKNVILSIISISAILISIPSLVFAVMPHYSDNPINLIISKILASIIPIIAGIYIIWGIKYIIKSKEGKFEKLKKIIKWFIITTITIVILNVGGSWVVMVGREYWSPASNTAFEYNKFAYAIGKIMRLIALGTIVVDAIYSAIYSIKSKENSNKKIKNIYKAFLITIIIVWLMLSNAPNVEMIGGREVKVKFWGN